MRPTAFMLLILPFAACSLKTDVVILDPTVPPGTPVLPDSVMLFDGPGFVLVDYEPIATVSTGMSVTGWIAPEQDDVVIALREAAAGVGAEGLILHELKDQRDAPSGGRTLGAEGLATAIRLTPAPSERDLASAPRRLQGVGTIAVAPTLRTDAPLPDSIGAEFDGYVEYGFEAAGFDVVAAAVYDSVRMAHIREVDGLFDPITGERYDERVRFVEQSTRRELIEAYGVDGFAVPEIWPVPASFEGIDAEWHGTTQPVSEVPDAVSGVLGVASAIIDVLTCTDDEDEDCDDSTGFSGTVPALSLTIRLENAIGADLYTGWGGIALSEMLDPETREATVVEDALHSAARNQRAVTIALERLGLRR